MPDQETAQTGDDCTDDKRDRRGDEQRVAFGVYP